MADYNENTGNFDSDADIQSIVVKLGDPGADLTAPIFRFSVAGRLRSAYAWSATTLAAGTAAYTVGLANGGASGTATTSVATAAGGTAGWVANTPKTIALTAGSENFSAGQYVSVVYDETNAVAENVFVQINYSLQPA